MNSTPPRNRGRCPVGAEGVSRCGLQRPSGPRCRSSTGTRPRRRRRRGWNPGEAQCCRTGRNPPARSCRAGNGHLPHLGDESAADLVPGAALGGRNERVGVVERHIVAKGCDAAGDAAIVARAGRPRQHDHDAPLARRRRISSWAVASPGASRASSITPSDNRRSMHPPDLPGDDPTQNPGWVEGCRTFGRVVISATAVHTP